MIGHPVIPVAHVHVHVAILDDERMLQQLLVFGPILVILEQAVVDKLAELDGEALVLGQAGRVVLYDLGEHLELCLAVLVGELSGGQLHQGDAEAPHVGPDVVVRLVGVGRIDPFRGHVGSAAGTPGLSF